MAVPSGMIVVVIMRVPGAGSGFGVSSLRLAGTDSLGVISRLEPTGVLAFEVMKELPRLLETSRWKLGSFIPNACNDRIALATCGRSGLSLGPLRCLTRYRRVYHRRQ